MTWIEGFPTEPGDYWFYMTNPGYPNLSRPIAGRTNRNGQGNLMHVAEDFLRPETFKDALHRIWHRPLDVPEPPDFDRTCPTCEGKKTYTRCFDCSGTGEL